MIHQVHDRLLYPIWGNDVQLKAFLWILARAAAGHFEDKVWSVVMGEHNSGKSIIGRLLKTTLDPYVTQPKRSGFCSEGDGAIVPRKRQWPDAGMYPVTRGGLVWVIIT
mgnify:CR=1 FL=1